MDKNSHNTQARMAQLKDAADKYFDSLKNKSFEEIPFDENAILRAPLTPAGVHVPLKGKEAIFKDWWQPLEPALEGVTINVLGYYFHEDLRGIMCEAEIILKMPSARLRVADRFTINEEGNITEQENHFDPREVL